MMNNCYQITNQITNPFSFSLNKIQHKCITLFGAQWLDVFPVSFLPEEAVILDLHCTERDSKVCLSFLFSKSPDFARTLLSDSHVVVAPDRI